MLRRTPAAFLRFASRGAYAIPHPSKKHRGGEDGFFLSNDGRTMGVADGVGGWIESGVNPALFTWAFMRHAMTCCVSDEAIDAKGIMNKAYDDTMKDRLEGSCPATIVALNDATTLSVANIGDCGVMVLRGDKIVFRSVEQQHSFNFPYQLGPRETPKLADFSSIEVAADDVVILGSDGLWDNMFDGDLVDLVRTSHSLSCDEMARVIADRTRDLSVKTDVVSPFGARAKEAGFRFNGGKEDDITVVVGRVAAVSDAAPVGKVTYSVVEDFMAAKGVDIMNVKNKRCRL
jgi:protein phosphatase PTC7